MEINNMEESVNDYTKRVICHINNLHPELEGRDTLIHDIISDEIHTLNLCRCCDRHQNNKPRHLCILDDMYIDTKPYVEHHCYCSCRHKTRILCRYFGSLTEQH